MHANLQCEKRLDQERWVYVCADGVYSGLRSEQTKLCWLAWIIHERTSEAELIIGVHRDPQFGLVLSLGAGGVLTELIRDSVQLLLPVSEEELRRILPTLRISALLEGYRGQPPGDVEALVAGILALARFCERNIDQIQELDINPFMVRARGSGAVAADTLIVMRTSEN